MSRLTRRAVVSLGLLGLAGCSIERDPFATLGGSQAPTAPSSPQRAAVAIGSAADSTAMLIAQLYRAGVAHAGLPVRTELALGTREVCLEALRSGAADVVPEFAGHLLDVLGAGDHDHSEAGPATLEDSAGPDFVVLKQARAEVTLGYYVTKAMSSKLRVRSLDDLGRLPSGTLAGQPDLESEGSGLPGLEGIYGARLRRFESEPSAAQRARLLTAGEVDLVALHDTDVQTASLVRLADPQQLLQPQPIVPLMRAAAAGDEAVTGAINAVQSALTTPDLRMLSEAVAAGQTVEAAAAAWVARVL